ncbi:MAG: zinc-ribbon domain-containing protein [Thermodesulfobacteriota bacterium]|nr:zinc-ribbon domain-containing protein [Thermodesulfobacteriota bacterium]
MEIKCPACQSGYRIPKEKLPVDKDVIAFPCPNCAHPLTVNLNEINEPDHPSEKKITLEKHAGNDDNMMDALSQSYDAAEKPFDFVHEGQRTALICESDPGVNQKIRQALENLNFYCAEAESTLAALKQMRYHVFDLVVLNESFDRNEPKNNPLRIYLGRLPMATRRNMFVILLTRRFRTMDNMAAFNLSVNQVIHEKNIDEMEQIIKNGIAENDTFYKVFIKTFDSLGDTNTV